MINTILGSLIFITTNLSLLYVCHLSARRFIPHIPPPVRLVAIGTLFYAFIIILLQVLSPFFAITKFWVTAFCLLLALAAHFLWGKLRDLNADIEPIRKWLLDGLSSRWAVLIIIGGFVVFLSFTRALLMPPLAWDALSYHLTFAVTWIKKGSLILFNAPDQIAENVHFPINGDIIATWYLLPFSSDVLVNTMNFPITLLGGIACYGIARELGLSRKMAGFAPALICFAPMIYSQITTQYIDNAVFAFSTSSVLFVLRYLKRGAFYDSILSITAAGILLGMKYTGIPVAGIIFLVIAFKTIMLVNSAGLLKKGSLIFASLLILFSLGGRQYIVNAIDARNPIYPLPLSILQHEIFEGSHKLHQVSEWISEWEEGKGFDKFSLWEKEYGKLLYSTRTAGPKFLLFLILAMVSFFFRPPEYSKKAWFLLTILWVVPVILFYVNTSADFARRGVWMQGSTRFLSFPIALFTIQGLFTINTLNRKFNGIDFLLAVFIAWDVLFNTLQKHLWEIEVVYPFILLLAVIVLLIFPPIFEKASQYFGKRKFPFASSLKQVKFKTMIANRLILCTICLIFIIVGFYFLETYRSNTRYFYYRDHADYLEIPKAYVDAWEFLDRPGEKKTIAMTMGWSPPGHKWFFYPLCGRKLQNDIEYISAKHKWSVPTWVDQGLLRGDDFSIWLHNLKRKEVDYILLAKPWPKELQWILRDKENFKLVFANSECQIFYYKRK
jgi:hypothetical protein